MTVEEPWSPEQKEEERHRVFPGVAGERRVLSVKGAPWRLPWVGRLRSHLGRGPCAGMGAIRLVEKVAA